MSTSGSYTYSSTRNFIIQEAFRKIGVLGDYESLDTERLQVGINALNPMIKAFHGIGMPLWALATTEKSLVFWGSSSIVTIGPGATITQDDKPLKIIQAMVRDGDNDYPMEVVSFDNFHTISNKAAVGRPYTLFFEPLLTYSRIGVWPLPDTTWQASNLFLRYQRPFQDFNSASDEPDFPVEWHEALIYNLAVRLAPTYGYPPNDRRELAREAKDMLKMALDFDQETGSLFIYPRKT